MSKSEKSTVSTVTKIYENITNNLWAEKKKKQSESRWGKYFCQSLLSTAVRNVTERKDTNEIESFPDPGVSERWKTWRWIITRLQVFLSER